MPPYRPEYAADRRSRPDDATGCAAIFVDNTLTVPWNVWDVVKAALLIVGLFVVSVVVALVVLLATPEDARSALEYHLGAVMGYGAMLAGVWFFSLRKYRVSWRALGFRRPALAHLLLLVPLALAMSWGFNVGYTLFISTLGVEALIPEQESIDDLLADSITPILYFDIIVLGPFIEEILFRGFILAGLIIRLGSLKGALISSAVFALVHLDLDVMPIIFVSGMLIAWLYIRTGSLWPPIAMHTISNGVSIIQYEMLN